jgi:hypothetical protein
VGRHTWQTWCRATRSGHLVGISTAHIHSVASSRRRTPTSGMVSSRWPTTPKGGARTRARCGRSLTNCRTVAQPRLTGTIHSAWWESNRGAVRPRRRRRRYGMPSSTCGSGVMGRLRRRRCEDMCAALDGRAALFCADVLRARRHSCRSRWAWVSRVPWCRYATRDYFDDGCLAIVPEMWARCGMPPIDSGHLGVLSGCLQKPIPDIGWAGGPLGGRLSWLQRSQTR